MANIEILNQSEREEGAVRALESNEDSYLKFKIVGEHEEANEQLNITEDIEKETLDQNGNIDFDSDIFEERIRSLKEQRKNAQDNKERSEINKVIKLTENVRKEVHLFGFDEVKQNYQDRKNKLENKNSFLKNPQEVQKIKNQKLSEIDPTGTVQNYANIENTAEIIDRLGILENLEKFKQEQYELVNQGKHDEAKEKYNTTYRSAVMEAYKLVGREHNKTLERKEIIDKKHEEMVRRLADGRTETNEELEERKRLQIESKTLDNIIKAYSEEFVQKELAEKHNLWIHLERNVGSNTQGDEIEGRENNEDEKRKWHTKLADIIGKVSKTQVLGALSGAAVGGAVATVGVLTGTVSVPITVGVAALMIYSGVRGKEPMFIGTKGFANRRISKIEKKLENDNLSEEEITKLNTELQKRKKWKEDVTQFTKAFSVGAGGGLLGFTGVGLLGASLAKGALDTAFASGGSASAELGAIGAGAAVGAGIVSEREIRDSQTLDLIKDLNISQEKIDEMRRKGVFKDEVLILDEKRGGPVAKIVGEFVGSIKEQMKLEEINKDLFLYKIEEIGNLHKQNQPINAKNMAMEVIEASRRI